MIAPIAKKIPFEITTHGDTRIDNYYWMRDMDRKDPEIISHLEAENAYTKAKLKHTEKFQEELFNELKGRIKQTDESVPYLYDGFYYYTRFEEGFEYSIYCRKQGGLDAEEQVMLDVNELAKDYSYYQAAGNSISTNNNILAFSEDTLSRRVYTIRFKDLTTGEFLEDRIDGTAGGCTWANDNKTVFYTVKDPVTLRSFKVYKHVLGTKSSEDVEVYHESDETFNVSVGKFKSKKWLYIHTGATVSDEYLILDAETPNGNWKVFQPRERDLEYGISHFNGEFYILTNKDDATNFKLVKTPENKTGLENWKEVIAHRKDVFLEDFDVFENHLVLTEKSNAQSAIRIINWTTNDDHYIAFEEEAYAVQSSINPEFKTQSLRFSYTSMTTPASVFEYNMETKDRTLLKQQEVLGGFEKDDYVAKRIWTTARDGAKVPMSLVYKKTTKIDKNTPLLLYGYGSYGITIDPSFSPSRLSLLNRGFVFCIAHIRGSQTMGREWYEDGKMLKKQNTFNDFIDCAENLIELEYTSSEHLYAMGGSAGGLLMGTIVNMRPDLWNGIISAVPFVDVVTTMLDESIPLTTGEFDEWGNPKDEEYYHYIKSYSPIDNIEAKAYPSMLVTTGLHDSQVQYWEPAKWVAKLRELKTDSNDILFHINIDFGHSGASGRFEIYHEIALEYAFLMDLESK
ncbi:S9 family peptidase [Salibacteraceae bacterium]|nr:S9 family peptidase [Salibacteraceae bacterium]